MFTFNEISLLINRLRYTWFNNLIIIVYIKAIIQLTNLKLSSMVTKADTCRNNNLYHVITVGV